THPGRRGWSATGGRGQGRQAGHRRCERPPGAPGRPRTFHGCCGAGGRGRGWRRVRRGRCQAPAAASRALRAARGVGGAGAAPAPSRPRAAVAVLGVQRRGLSGRGVRRGTRPCAGSDADAASLRAPGAVRAFEGRGGLAARRAPGR
ncbi:unnamed protein product, partial [Prorocentrum cordatum]